MSVSHPALKSLKGHIYELRNDKEKVSDYHAVLLPLCRTLEEIFQTGLKSKLNTPFGVLKKDYWFWIQLLYEQRETYRIPFALTEVIECVMKSKKVYTNIGRGRLLIRCCLSHRQLSTLITLLWVDELFLFTVYDPKSSILGNEIMSEIFSSLLHELDKINFKLELKNASFLDETWCLGIYKKFEFVPCKEMGITFAYIKGRVVVVKVEAGSVAGEENQIEPGDVLDELYEHSLYRCNRSLISSLTNKYRGLPIYLSVVKGLYVGSIYSPLKPIFTKLEIKTIKQEKKPKEKDFVQDYTSDSSSGRLKFVLHMLGKFDVANNEKAECIDKAITKALSFNQDIQQPVVMYVSERDITVMDKDEKEVLVNKHFSEISACGRKKLCPDIFAFIFGNTTCTIAEDFKCIVLKAKSSTAITSILELIAHGFVKTHWEV